MGRNDKDSASISTTENVIYHFDKIKYITLTKLLSIRMIKCYFIISESLGGRVY